jgi:uncharacterized protein involved in exopolysaccharide biosynthesis
VDVVAANPSNETSDGALTIERVLLLVWARRTLFVAVAVAATAMVIAYAYLATPTYRVAIKLMPRNPEGPAGGLQSLLGQFSGMAALAGIGLGNTLDEQEALAWLKSRALFETFAKQQNMMPILFADAWDERAGSWRTDLKHVPTMDDAWSFFDRQIRRVNQDSKTKVVTLEIAWKDRKLAAQWANAFVQLANEELRRRALLEADASLKSLEEQLEGTETVELRQSIYRLSEMQVNRKVLAKSRLEYAFAVLDPATVPDRNRFASPRRPLLKLIALPFGLFSGLSVILMLDFATRILPFRLRARAAAREPHV